MKLKLNHATLKPLGLGQVLSEFTGKFPINIELEIVAPGNDVHGVPIALLYVIGTQRIFNGCDGGFIILTDHQSVPTETAMFLTAGRVKIPCAHNILTNPQVTQVRVVTLEITFTCFIDNGTDIYSAITLTGKAVAEL